MLCAVPLECAFHKNREQFKTWSKANNTQSTYLVWLKLACPEWTLPVSIQWHRQSFYIRDQLWLRTWTFHHDQHELSGGFHGHPQLKQSLQTPPKSTRISNEVKWLHIHKCIYLSHPRCRQLLHKRPDSQCAPN